MGTLPPMPALATTMSNPPQAATTWRTTASTAPGAATSALSPSTVCPWPSSSRTIASVRSGNSSTTATRAPARASARAVLRPMPLPAPVTSARWPVRSIIVRSSRHQAAAVDVDDLAGDVRAVLREQEEDQVGDVPRLADAVQRIAHQPCLHLLLGAAGEPAGHGSV